MVQYTWKVPAVLNGPIGALSFPLNCNLTVGAPGSWAGFCSLPTQLPLTMICGDVLSSTRLTDSPFLMVTLFWRKSAPPICTVGPAAATLLSLIVQAANKIVSKPNTTVANNAFLYMFQ